jgi:hypothetical protein
MLAGAADIARAIFVSTVSSSSASTVDAVPRPKASITVAHTVCLAFFKKVMCFPFGFSGYAGYTGLNIVVLR